MKYFFLGIFFTIAVSTLAHYHWLMDGKYERLAFQLNDQIISGGYLLNPLTGRCSTTQVNARGISEAQWFNCDKFQQWLNLE